MKECKILTCDNFTASNRPAGTAGGSGLTMLWENPDLEGAVDRYLAQGWEIAQISRQGASLTIVLTREKVSIPHMTQMQENAEAGAPEEAFQRPGEEETFATSF